MSDTSGDKEEEEVSFGTCIVCQEDLNGADGKIFGALGLIQPSRLVRRHPDGQNGQLNEVLGSPSSMDRAGVSTGSGNLGSTSGMGTSTTFPPSQADLLDSKAVSPNFEGFPSNYTRFGLHSSVCSHMMHLDCFQVYSVSIRQRHRAQATRNHPECIPRKEYICPLCKSLGNVILPVTHPDWRTQLNPIPFSDWIRAAGIHILKSKPDPLLESLQFRNGTGEFVFWSAQDPGYASVVRKNGDRERVDALDGAKMLDTVMVISKSISQQTRHLRDRLEPESTERGAGIYLPEELVGYTISAMEVAQRGVGADPSSSSSSSLTGSVMMVDALSESQTRMIRGLLACLTRLVALQFKNRPDEGRDAVRQAIIKRLLPEWSRTSLTSFSYPLLLRDPFTILVETAAVTPEMLRHVLVLTYYACLARTVIGLVYILNKARSYNTTQVPQRAHQDIFGDVRMFFMSVVRHSPVFEHTATIAFEIFGEARIEKLLYAFTLPFLRRAAILCRSVLPSSFPTPIFDSDVCEYTRLLAMLDIPPLSDLPRQDTLQNALSGWCAHYGHSHASAQLNCGVLLDYPAIYRLARLPLILDSLFNRQDKALMCTNCNTFAVDAAICLICGTTVCLQSNCCIDEDYNNRGECNMHTREYVSLSFSPFFCFSYLIIFFLAGLGVAGLSEYIIVSRDVLCFILVQGLVPLRHPLILMPMAKWISL
jgi:E3 ubiquitin-protein ligase UBR1